MRNKGLLKKSLFVLMLAGSGLVMAGEVVIGNLQDLSGPTSVLGNAVTRGAEVAVEKINAAGGIKGDKIKLITADTKGNVQEAIKAFTRLIDHEKSVVVLGPPVSNIGLAIAPIANEKKIPVIGSFIDPRVTVQENGEAQPSMFLIQPTSVQFAEIIASYANEKLGYKKFAVLYDQSNAFAVSMYKPFKAYIEKRGGTIVAEETFTKADKDYRAQLNKIKASGAEALYVPNYTQDLVITVKQAKQIGMTMPMFSGLDAAPPFATLVGDPDAADNMFFANNFSDKEPQLTEVRNAYKAKFNEEPINKAYLGYDKVTVIAKAVELGGGATGPQIIAGLSQIKNVQGTTGVITLSPKTHQPLGLSMVMYKIVKGKYEEIGRYVPESHKQ
ncbi:ABC transporter substrate-binding protein [uncultured Propionivibrio sp.]|uniref:ABC transporter substrate-binding protein n=1 Tax=uncultured Propionivibrio sp. TaxID=426737 RepID=UPI0029C0CA01|nr:ABC transporter substrate-binding protein [uncultured Propionivibrio sp.]